MLGSSLLRNSFHKDIMLHYLNDGMNYAHYSYYIEMRRNCGTRLLRLGSKRLTGWIVKLSSAGFAYYSVEGSWYVYIL